MRDHWSRVSGSGTSENRSCAGGFRQGSKRGTHPRRGRFHHDGGARKGRREDYHSDQEDESPDLSYGEILENPLVVFAAYFEFTTSCSVPEEVPACSKCQSRRKERCSCRALSSRLGHLPGYVIGELQHVKDALNTERSRLDEIDIEQWKAHTSRTLTTSRVVPAIRRLRGNATEAPPEMVTNAWCKLYEILRGCQLITEDLLRSRSPPELRTVHLCECPGAFVCATNHYLRTAPELKRTAVENTSVKFSWQAVSLNPYFEGNDMNAMIDDDAFYRHSYTHWLRGVDDSGNIKNVENIESFTRHVTLPNAPDSFLPGTSGALPKKPSDFRMVDIVTADGSVDSQYDANAQEMITASLHFAEVVAALKLLGIGGHFVLKMFTLFEHHSLSIMALLSCLFKKVFVVKPVMSRAGSGEVYVVAKGFGGLSSALGAELLRCLRRMEDDVTTCLFPREWISDDYFREYCACATVFAERQTLAIKANLSSYYAQDFRLLDADVARQRILCVKRFLGIHALRPIAQNLKLVPEADNLTGRDNNSTRKGRRERVGGIQNDRLVSKKMSDELQRERGARYFNSRTVERQGRPVEAPSKRERIKLKETICEAKEKHEAKDGLASTSDTFNLENFPNGSEGKQVKEGKVLGMMRRMEYTIGRGLGKLEQGAVEPVAAQLVVHQKQRGLRTATDCRLPTRPFSVLLLPGDSPLRVMCNKICRSASVFNYRRARKIYCGGVPNGMEAGGRPTIEDSQWLTWGTPLAPCQVRISRFMEASLLAKVLEARVQGPAGDVELEAVTDTDCLLLESGKVDVTFQEDSDQDGLTLVPLRFPVATSVDLACVLAQRWCGKSLSHLKEEEEGREGVNHTGAVKQEHHLKRVLRKVYTSSSVLEITNNMNFGLSALLRPLGISTRVILGDHAVGASLARPATTPSGEPVSRESVLEEYVSSRIPGSAPFDFIRPFYAKTIIANRLTSDALIDLTLRKFAASKPSRLVYVDPSRKAFDEIPSFPREYAETEISSLMTLLAMTLVGLFLVAEHGDMILRLESVVTRATATLLLLLSMHFSEVVIYRPPSVSAWTSVRYVHCIRAKFAPRVIKNSQSVDGDATPTVSSAQSVTGVTGGNFSPILSYLAWCWDSSIKRFPNVVIMQFLPPLAFTNEIFNQWLTECNVLLGEEELEDLKLHRQDTVTADMKGCGNGFNRCVSGQKCSRFCTAEERQTVCKRLLQSVKLLGFFFPKFLSPDEIRPKGEEPARFVKGETLQPSLESEEQPQTRIPQNMQGTAHTTPGLWSSSKKGKDPATASGTGRTAPARSIEEILATPDHEDSSMPLRLPCDGNAFLEGTTGGFGEEEFESEEQEEKKTGSGINGFVGDAGLVWTTPTLDEVEVEEAAIA